MPRPSLGRQGRSLSAGLRITGVEHQWLAETYGTVSAGLRAALDLLIQESVVSVEAEPVKAPAGQMHLCRIWIEEKYEYVRGTATLVEKTCAECNRVVKTA